MDFSFLLQSKLIVAEAALAVLPFVLPNSWVERVFFGFGKTVSVLLRQKIGRDPGERVEKHFQGTISAAVAGLNRGLDADD